MLKEACMQVVSKPPILVNWNKGVWLRPSWQLVAFEQLQRVCSYQLRLWCTVHGSNVSNVYECTHTNTTDTYKCFYLISWIVTVVAVDRSADPFAKPAFPINTKSNPMDYFGDSSSLAQTPNKALESDEASIGSIAEPKGQNSLDDDNIIPGYGKWHSPLHDLPDSDIESIILSQELDSPLLPMLGCHGIHKDGVDHINNPLHLIQYVDSLPPYSCTFIS